MPTPEEIKKIARLFAYETSNGDALDPHIDFAEEFAVEVLQWLSKDFCIVPKSLLKEHYEDVCEDIRDYDGKGKFGLSCADMTMYQRARGMKQMLYRLFGKSLFNEEKE